MILAIDVYYKDNKAKSVGILFNGWGDYEPNELISVYLENINEYESGSFYKRELPCMIALLEKIDLSKIKVIIVDGYVYLDDHKKLGLGGYLYEYLENKIPVIGVAKNAFHSNTKMVSMLLRGKSVKKLFVSAAGIEIEEAAHLIKSMHGDYRIPTLLKKLDQETKIWN